MFGVSSVVWRLIDHRRRPLCRGRVLGQDYAELGIEAFPEFMLVEED